eukprot:6082558-Pyramimonas_sp.AAC.2
MLSKLGMAGGRTRYNTIPPEHIHTTCDPSLVLTYASSSTAAFNVGEDSVYRMSHHSLLSFPSPPLGMRHTPQDGVLCNRIFLRCGGPTRQTISIDELFKLLGF